MHQGEPITQREAKLHALDYWQVLRNRYGVVLLAFFLVFMTATVITYMLPNQYLGRVKMQIHRSEKTGEVFPGTVSTEDSALLPHSTFMQNQFEIIESKETLNRVIAKLGLVELWNLPSTDDAYKKLRRKLSTEEKRGTDIIDVEIFHTDPELSAKLANEVAEAYRERRTELAAKKAQKALATLDLNIRRQNDKLHSARNRMFEKMEENDIPDIGILPPWARGSQPDTGTGRILLRSKEDVYAEQQNVESLTAQIETLKKLDGEALFKKAGALGVGNTSIATLLPGYQKLRIEQARLAESGLGPQHPQVKAVETQIATTKTLLLEESENVKATLESQLELAKQKLAAYTRSKDAAVEDSMSEKHRSVEYVEAKKKYDLANQVLNDMEEQHAQETIDWTMPDDPIEIHEYATPSLTPAKPNVQLHLVLGAVVGLVFGVGLAFFLEYMDTSVKSLEDVERYLEVPVLAVIPKDVGVLHKQSGMSPDAEAYRILRTNIEFNRKTADANAITVVSGGAGEGKSTTLVNLAYICAQGGYSTLMIDGDLRRPRLHTFFDINNAVGLTNYLTTDLALEDVVLQTPVDNLYFLPSGILPADAAGILNSRRMSELIADVKSRFDLVLIDSPPILGVSDASVLASECDLTMIVIQHRKLPRNMLVRVKQAVESVGGTLLGVVLNNVDVRSDSQYQYYTSYYTYYAPANMEGQVKSRIATPSPSVDDAPGAYVSAETGETTPAESSADY